MILLIMKKCFQLTLFCFGLLQFLACAQEPPPPVTVDPNPIYESCCGADPIEYNENGFYVYVPNLFTPNKDGINDVFAPVYADEKVEYISTCIIYQDTIIEPGPIYYDSGYMNPKKKARWWDGKLPDGTQHVGPFEYVIQFVMTDGSYRTIEGRACLVQCGPDAAEFTNRAGCYFGTQAKGTRFDKSAANKEEDCFK
jgi:hypothetical protein